MADLINRDALIKKVCAECGVCERHWGKDAKYKCNEIERILNAPAVNRWISVNDALPEENARCLVCTEGGGYGISRRMGRNIEKWTCFGLQVTHWMPLPPLPVPPEKE